MLKVIHPFYFQTGLLVVLVAISGCGKPGIGGRVTIQETPVAAGTITFEKKEAPHRKWVGVINDGNYQIDTKVASAEYNVKIDVHFADADQAKDFYAAMSAELNMEKILHGNTPEAVPSREETKGEDASPSQPPAKSPMQSHVFQTNLNSGSNRKDFEIGQ